MIRLTRELHALTALLDEPVADPVSTALDGIRKAQLPLAKRIERQEAAEYHAAELEEEYGPLSRDAHFDERFQSVEDDDPYTDDRSEEIDQ